MTARDALASIRERLNHEPCCDHSGRDEHGCWDCRNTGHAHPPYADGQASGDLGALVGALEAVLVIHQPEWTSDQHGGGYYRCSADHWTLDDQTPSCPTVKAIETAMEDL